MTIEKINDLEMHFYAYLNEALEQPQVVKNQTEENCFCVQTWKRASSLIGRRPPSLTFAAGSPGIRIKTYQNFGCSLSIGSNLIAKS